MALHGTIQVNSNTLGVWAAVRRPDSDDGSGVLTYDVEAIITEVDGISTKYQATVLHAPVNGALALATEALSAIRTVRNMHAV